ncbi:hypothetical protein [Streptomyces sp. NPDC093598]|uniref:hypothetical protein n=1 Tax=Streptomyces sp. NPDC093598 TaxID=3366046 RepID=UPI0038007792
MDCREPDVVGPLGLSTLPDIHRSACRDGIVFHLVGVGPALRRLFELTGTHAYLTTPQLSATGAGRAAAGRPGGPRPPGG